MISFLNGAMLWGLLAVAIPVVIHFMHRRRSRQVWFPSLMFLLRIDAKTMRRKRLREWLLLAARCLLLALLALAAAEPVLADRQATGGNTAMVVVLDTSYSMGYREENVARFQRARETALLALKSLQPEDRAALVLPGDDAPVDLTQELGALRTRVSRATSGHGAERLRDAVERAVEVLRDASEQNREILLLGDLQSRSLDGLEGLSLPEGVRVYVADHGSDLSPNLTLVDVTAGEGTAVLGLPVTVSAAVANRGSQATATGVSLYSRDGETEERVATRSVSVGPGEQVTVTFDVTPEEPGDLTGRVALDGDALPGDDERWFAVPVLDRVDLLAVNGDPSETLWLDETYFLRAALDPSGLGATEIATPFRLTVVLAEDLGTRDLSAFRAVLLANVGTLPREAALDLATYVRRGGGLIVFAGSRCAPQTVRETFGPGGPAEGLLPRLPSRPLSFHADSGELPRLGEIDRTHVVFREMDEAFLEDAERVRSTQALDLSGEGGRVLIRFEDRRPFLVEGEVGAGRVLQFAVTADADWCNLPKRPLFVALLHRGLYHLMRGGAESRSGRFVGSALPLPNPAALGPGGSIEVYAPDREDDPARFTDADRATAVFADTGTPGLYRIVRRTGDGTSETRVPVNVDPDEGRLDRWTLDALESALDPAEVLALDPGGDVEEALVRARTGRPIWGPLLVLALLLLVVEAFLANRWTRPPARVEETVQTETGWAAEEPEPEPVMGGRR